MKFDELGIPKTPFERFKEFVGKGRCFKEVCIYFKENNLHKSKGQPAVYKFTGLDGMCYYGKADDLIRRLRDYVNENNINEGLKESIWKNGRHFFKFAFVQEYNHGKGVTKITLDNILDAEHWFTNQAEKRGVKLFNLINKKDKVLPKSNKKIKSKYEKTKDNFDGFDDLLNKGFII